MNYIMNYEEFVKSHKECGCVCWEKVENTQYPTIFRCPKCKSIQIRGGKGNGKFIGAIINHEPL